MILATLLAASTGMAAPALDVTWVETRPDLRDKVVLLRWWTDGCELCRDAQPVLEHLHRKYAARGLVVVGVYHPKPSRPVTEANVRAAATKLGLTFALAIDADWAALRRWNPDGGFTSPTFLLDKDGVVRFTHPGGRYSAADAAALRKAVARLLRR